MRCLCCTTLLHVVSPSHSAFSLGSRTLRLQAQRSQGPRHVRCLRCAPYAYWIPHRPGGAARRYRYPSACGLEADDQLELHRLLHGELSGFAPLRILSTSVATRRKLSAKLTHKPEATTSTNSSARTWPASVLGCQLRQFGEYGAEHGVGDHEEVLHATPSAPQTRSPSRAVADLHDVQLHARPEPPPACRPTWILRSSDGLYKTATRETGALPS